MKKYKITKSFLLKEYINKVKKESEIADIIGCATITISRKLKEYNIKTRRSFKGENSPHYNKILINCPICNKEFKIKQSRRKRSKIICCSFKCSNQWRKTLKGKKAPSFKDGRTLKKYYCEDCGKELKGVTAFLRNKCFSCSRKYVGTLFKGENHWNWQGGKSFELYPLGWNKTFKEQIRYRDGYKCQICGVPEVECNKKLSIHHIDYNKENLKPKNLISLCQSCHVKTNFKRENWKEYFKIKGEISCRN